MNPGDQLLLARAKAQERRDRLEARLRTQCEGIAYWTNIHIHGSLESLDEQRVLSLAKDFAEGMAEYRRVLEELRQLEAG
jgi:hypothetical protein